MLNLLSIALQGFAPGFKLSPIAIAVQGLIEQIQEEQRREDVRGSGKARTTAKPPADTLLRTRADADADLEALVRSQWELLEARRQAQQADAAPAITRESGNPPAAPAPAITAESGAPPGVKESLTVALTNPKAQAAPPAVAGVMHASDGDDVALLLMLAEIA